MSAPDTNVKKQAWRHRGPLVGMAVVVILATGFLGWLLIRTMVVEPEPPQQEAPVGQIEDGTGIPADGTVTGPVNQPTENPEIIDEPTPPAPGDQN
ncbi:hypothetical protein [Roseinatronobacter alkalisoli]|uniref:SPOR domain-containing protein n=1 Tax=Roseinatronobacter alkalisoli TaxID=3028235 RepID=A0ABT5T8S3_9RHOB|nr:hypothetical protein [Roseinatronobacter sp. HJB301]MDD7971359.1 hypothetical protein [Roseinatronobacter sp. HJB301]